MRMVTRLHMGTIVPASVALSLVIGSIIVACSSYSGNTIAVMAIAGGVAVMMIAIAVWHERGVRGQQ